MPSRRLLEDAALGRVTMACRGTRSQVDGPEVCTVCLDPLPLPGPGKDCVLVLHACGHAVQAAAAAAAVGYRAGCGRIGEWG